MVAILKYGKTWFKVPDSIKVRLYNETSNATTTRDVMFHLMRLLGPEEAVGKIIEYWDYSSSGLNMDDKMMLTSLSAELGVASALFAPDNIKESQSKLRDNRYRSVIDTEV